MYYKKLFILLSIVLYCGCSIKRPTRIVPIYKVGTPLNIIQLLTKFDLYDVYYSPPIFNPSAIVFLKKRRKIKIYLHKDWNIIKEKKELKELLLRINYLNPSLYAIVDNGRRKKEVEGYIYTSGICYLKSLRNNEYFLYPVEEQFNDIYYGGDKIDRVGGLKFF
jgi:hypothetical protein